MTTLWWVLGVLVGNIVIGAAVWAAIDDDEQSLLSWFKKCPPQISFVAQPLVLFVWPVGVWFWWRARG